MHTKLRCVCESAALLNERLPVCGGGGDAAAAVPAMLPPPACGSTHHACAGELEVDRFPVLSAGQVEQRSAGSGASTVATWC